jgi:hypothetical protein
MFARLVRFSFGPGAFDAAKQLSNDLLPQISAQPGCKSATTFGEQASGEYGLFVLWESREAADAASAVIGPQLQRHLSENNARDSATMNLFEVIDSRP